MQGNILITLEKEKPFLDDNQSRQQKDYRCRQKIIKTPIEQKVINDMENESQTGKKFNILI